MPREALQVNGFACNHPMNLAKRSADYKAYERLRPRRQIEAQAVSARAAREVR
jgi:hypothetical protein